MLSMGARFAWPAGMGVERQPEPQALTSASAGTSSRMGSNAWPRRLEWSGAVSSPISISLTRSKP